MTTAQSVGDPCYHETHHYSPPVSPKSQPHGTKRRAQAEDEDDVEDQNQFSNSFKKLRLSRPSYVRHDSSSRISHPTTTRRGSTNPPHALQPPLQQRSHEEDENDLMTIDNDDNENTTDRVFVHDLDWEVAQIEAAEAAEAEAEDAKALRFSSAAEHYSKIPEQILRTNDYSSSSTSDGQGMQLVLYRDPVSISIPEEHDAVRKAIIAARQRARDEQSRESERSTPPGSIPRPVPSLHEHESAAEVSMMEDPGDAMDID